MWKAMTIVCSVCAVGVFPTKNCITNEFERNWISGVVTRASDFATAGVSPNGNYFCWEPCAQTNLVSQKMKIKRAEKSTTSPKTRFVNRRRRDISPIDDRECEFCIDLTLCQDVKEALKTVTNHSAQAIARTLLYQIGRPGWVYNVVEAPRWTGNALDIVIKDENFCHYDYDAGILMFDIHMVALDMS